MVAAKVGPAASKRGAVKVTLPSIPPSEFVTLRPPAGRVIWMN